ncbi:hypothetical protein IWW50_006210 [Coemansia erecta]|nr:hypothetical protein IWW50_006210 [Coemansia erecta]
MPVSYSANEQIPDSAPESATQTANNTAVCTPVAASARGSGTAHTSGDFTKVGDGRQRSAAAPHSATMQDSPTHYATRKQTQGGCNILKPWADPAEPSLDAVAAASVARLQGTKAHHNADMYANSSVCDRQMRKNDSCQEADACAGFKSDLSRHPTLVFDQSPFFRTSTLMNTSASASRAASTLHEDEHGNDDAGGLDVIEELAGMELDSGPSCMPVPVSALPRRGSTAAIDESDGKC